MAMCKNRGYPHEIVVINEALGELFSRPVSQFFKFLNFLPAPPECDWIKPAGHAAFADFSTVCS
jgi:hypothetical protein